MRVFYKAVKRCGAETHFKVMLIVENTVEYFRKEQEVTTSEDLAWLSEHKTIENQELRASNYHFAWF